MDSFTIDLNLTGAENVTDLHIHVGPEQELLTKVDGIVADLADVLAKVGEVNTAVGSLMETATETLKDVQRLVAQGDTQPALDALEGVITNLTAAKDKVAEADAAVEAASPETPTPPAEPTPEPEPSPLDNL